MYAADNQAGFQLLQVLGAVSFLFLFVLGIVWVLMRFGEKLSADFRAKLNRRGSSLAISAHGFVGCYLAILAAAFSAFFLIAHFVFR